MIFHCGGTWWGWEAVLSVEFSLITAISVTWVPYNQ